jgi:hydrogenase expression/formation protein HypC
MCLAVPGKIVAINGDDLMTRTAKVSFSGVIKEVSLTCLPEAKLDDFVLVHVGMALSVVDPDEAALVFQYLREMEALSNDTEGMS